MLTYNLLENMLGLRNAAFASLGSYNGRSNEDVSVNIYQYDDSLEIKSILPGVKSEDVSVELIDNAIVISGEKKQEHNDNSYIKRERNFGNFKRKVNLPYRVDVQSLQASLNNGILTIKMNKSEDAKPKKIDIQ